MSAAGLTALLARDRRLVVAGVALLSLLAWAGLIAMARTSGASEQGALECAFCVHLTHWTATDFLLTFSMWVVMMVAMMLPSVAPAVLLFARVERQSRDQGKAFAPTGLFLGGYLAAWTALSLVATVAQWLLARAARLSPASATTSPWLGGALLVAAGVYQLTRFKRACLEHCRSPVSVFTQHFRAGRLGALRMGFEHGLFCVGCCWGLMALLFVGGVMNFVWIAAIAIFVLLEKLAPWPRPVAAVSALLLVAAGVWVAAGGARILF